MPCVSLWLQISVISSIEVTPYLPPGVTITPTVTTTEKDFDNMRFTFINEFDEDDPRPAQLNDYYIERKYEETKFTIDPTITTEIIYRTEPVYVTANPLTFGIISADYYDKNDKYYV